MTKMSLFDATMIAEQADGYDTYSRTGEGEDEYLEAWQLLVDTGTCWKLQGCFGRYATALIEAGHIHAKGENP